QLMVEDQSAYAALSATRKLPEGSPERQDRLPAALLASIRTPQAIAATAVAVLELCDRIAGFVNYYLLSDLAVCADLAMAAPCRPARPPLPQRPLRLLRRLSASLPRRFRCHLPRPLPALRRPGTLHHR